ncbi:nucleotide pyrophosphohydrolase [Noviherbaspirillum aridicola]|uniref:Nucleotide pyrophosphohydrolase n=1 Tax=Noviherbaspirillum aridicola TaxID=2849687 RepID=A0ABQ4Q7M6_9BURK|nr:nucleotide pyrophosphohydrolase [Noviherbaspirillum aridicola]GIZ53057.1 nucleotide pyrophosphohydrolase [Noviherbaspirillum aridicola]
MEKPDLDTIRRRLETFRDERDWRQFHTLKDLIISVNLEAAELLELTQWKRDDELSRLRNDPAFQERLREECADVFLYLLLVAGEAGFDLLQAAADKIEKNAVKYPVERARGSARKYSELGDED